MFGKDDFKVHSDSRQVNPSTPQRREENQARGGNILISLEN